MDEEQIARLQAIAHQTWQGNFDERLGLSFEEIGRRAAECGEQLPATEYLLADKVHHLIKRLPQQMPSAEFGFKLCLA